MAIGGAFFAALRRSRRLPDGRVVWDVSRGGRGPTVKGGVFHPGRAGLWSGLVATLASIPLVVAVSPRLGQAEGTRADTARVGPDEAIVLAQDTSTTTVHPSCTHTDTTGRHTDLHHDQDVGGQHYDTHADGAPHNDHC